jgi:hypothetical protein
MAADAAFSRESGRLRESGNRAEGRGCFIHAAFRVCINHKTSARNSRRTDLPRGRTGRLRLPSCGNAPSVVRLILEKESGDRRIKAACRLPAGIDYFYYCVADRFGLVLPFHRVRTCFRTLEHMGQDLRFLRSYFDMHPIVRALASIAANRRANTGLHSDYPLVCGGNFFPNRQSCGRNRDLSTPLVLKPAGHNTIAPGRRCRRGASAYLHNLCPHMSEAPRIT